MQLKVSVIIPIYNAMPYLKEALQSVCNQSYRNLEILLVDDGSNDGSGIYCDQEQQKDTRIRVFHNENSGTAATRNYALKMATGDYSIFVDADDMITLDCVEMMIQCALRSDSQIVVCRWMSGLRYSPEFFCSYQTAAEPNSTVIDLSAYRWTGRYSHTTMGGFMCSTALAKSLSFSGDLYVGEDTLFFAQALKKAGRFVLIDEKYYYYRYHLTSVSHTAFQAKKLTEIMSWERISELYADQSESAKNECEAAIATICKKNYINASAINGVEKTILRELYKKAWIRRQNIWRSTEYPSGTKIRFAAFLLFPRQYSAWVNRKKQKSIDRARKRV